MPPCPGEQDHSGQQEARGRHQKTRQRLDGVPYREIRRSPDEVDRSESSYELERCCPRLGHESEQGNTLKLEFQPRLNQARARGQNAARPVDDGKAIHEVFHREEKREMRRLYSVIGRCVPRGVSTDPSSLTVGGWRDRIQVITKLIGYPHGFDKRIESAGVGITV